MKIAFFFGIIPIAIAFFLGLANCSVQDKEGTAHPTHNVKGENRQSLAGLYSKVFEIENKFQSNFLTHKGPADFPTYLSSIRERYAALDAELVAAPQYSDAHEFAKLRNSLMRRYGATSFFLRFGEPITDRYGSVLYVSVNAAEFKEFTDGNPQWRSMRLSSLLKYRLEVGELISKKP